MKSIGALRQRLRKEVISLLAIGVLGATIRALVGVGPDGTGGLGLIESFVAAAVIVALGRMIASVRRRIRSDPESPLDAVPPQPGELQHLPPRDRLEAGRKVPRRLGELEGMIRVAAADPEYFVAELKPVIDALNGTVGETLVLEEVPRGFLAAGRRRGAIARNVERIAAYAATGTEAREHAGLPARGE